MPGRSKRRDSGRVARLKMKTLRQLHGDACWLCGQSIDFSLERTHGEAWTLDHVLPRSQGGVNANRNLRLAHRTCNQARGDTRA